MAAAIIVNTWIVKEGAVRALFKALHAHGRDRGKTGRIYRSLLAKGWCS